MAAAPSAAPERREERSKSPSGRLLLRMPAELHAELARAAEREGVSLNAFITSSLASRIGWGDAPAPAPAETPDDRRTRTVLAVLVANAIVLAVAAATAIAILVLAWRG